MGSPVTWLRNYFIDRLLRLNLFLPLVAVGAVVVVILAPVLWSFYEASFYFGSRDAAPAAHVYEVNRGTEKYLEQAFALDNGIQGFSPVERDLMLKFTIDKVADLDLARRTVFVSGWCRLFGLQNHLASKSLLRTATRLRALLAMRSRIY